MQNFNSNENLNFSNNVKQFELDEAKKRMGIQQNQEQPLALQQLSNQQINFNQQ